MRFNSLVGNPSSISIRKFLQSNFDYYLKQNKIIKNKGTILTIIVTLLGTDIELKFHMYINIFLFHFNYYA